MTAGAELVPFELLHLELVAQVLVPFETPRTSSTGTGSF